jgi:hypothetical protein
LCLSSLPIWEFGALGHPFPDIPIALQFDNLQSPTASRARVLSWAGASPTSQVDSLLIVRHGKIVTEAYYAPYATGILHQVNSVTKAVTSTLTAIA